MHYLHSVIPILYSQTELHTCHFFITGWKQHYHFGPIQAQDEFSYTISVSAAEMICAHVSRDSVLD